MKRIRSASRLPALIALALFTSGANFCMLGTFAPRPAHAGRANCGMDPGPAESAACAAKQCASHTQSACPPGATLPVPAAPAKRGPSPCCDAIAPAAATDAPRLASVGLAGLHAILSFSFRLPRPVCGGFTRLSPNRANPPPESPPAVLLGRAPPVV